MKRIIIFTVIYIAALTCTVQAGSISDPMTDPFGYFNVYSLGNIGASDDKYHSDFQGIAGAADDVYFEFFSLHGMDSATGFTLHAGGSAALTGSYLVGVEVGGDLTLGSSSGGMNINGNVVVGGDVHQLSGGTIDGDVLAGGMIYLDDTMTVTGQKLSGIPFESILDHSVISDFFRDTSAIIGGWEATGEVTDEWGNLIFNGNSGVNVVDVDAGTLKNAWGFTINAPSDAVVYINVRNASEQTVLLDWTGWNYNGGITPGNVLLNMSGIATLNLTSTNAVNILAPLARTTFDTGLVTGSLIVGDLQGGGQVNLGHFDMGGSAGDMPVPEPGTMAMLLAGLPGLWYYSARRKGRGK